MPPPAQVCRKRPDFKLIVTSATLDAEKFSEYFDYAPIFKVRRNTPRTRSTAPVHTRVPYSMGTDHALSCWMCSRSCVSLRFHKPSQSRTDALWVWYRIIPRKYSPGSLVGESVCCYGHAQSSLPWASEGPQRAVTEKRGPLAQTRCAVNMEVTTPCRAFVSSRNLFPCSLAATRIPRNATCDCAPT